MQARSFHLQAGPAIGPTLGGWLVTNYSWQWIFWVNLPIGIAATLMCLAFLPSDTVRNAAKKVDYLGIGLLIVWVGCLQTFLEEGNQDDWFDSSFITWLCTFAVIGSVLWVWRELKTRAPAVDLRVLRHKSLAAGSVYSFLLGTALYGTVFAVPIFTQQVLGYTAYQTGMVLLPGALASMIVMPIMGRISGRFDPRTLIAIGTLILISGLYWLSHMSISTSAEDLFWPLILRGAGTVMIFLPLSLATFSGVPRNEVSSASGFFNLTRQLGGSVGIAVLTTLLAQREALHRSNLVEHVSSYSMQATERLQALTSGFISKGADPVKAKELALAVIDRQINVQSAVMSFGDLFYLTVIMFILSFGLLFFLSGRKGAAPAGGAAH